MKLYKARARFIIAQINIKEKINLVPLAGLEPARPQRATDFESVVSTIPPQRRWSFKTKEQKIFEINGGPGRT